VYIFHFERCNIGHGAGVFAGLKQQKKVIVIMSAMAILASVRVSPNACAIMKMMMMMMGTGFTRLIGQSSFVYTLI
jgi:CelD/BcsL family acetyltransferase involved in cellulose biosynthesis